MKKQSTLTSLLAISVLVAGLLLQSIFSKQVYAAQITARSLTLQAGATDGGSKPGGVVNHLYGFTVPTTGNVGSILFLYCTTAAGTCTTPTGLVTTSASIGSQSGATGFSINNATNGAPYITRTAASITGGTALSYQLLSVTNPTTTNYTFFVRISTYASTDTTGALTDSGTVTASTATPIILDGTMPESLVFCTGGTVGTTSGVPDCATATSGNVSFNQLFSPTDTAYATSQMAASTNAGSGYVITVNGPTLTSGSNTVTAMGTSAASVKGLSQFGMNLKANTVTAASGFPGTSAEIAPASNGTNYRAQSLAGYDTVDFFKFTTGDSVADSAYTAAGGTDAQIYTASYIVNVPGSQPAGTYTTTLTYICTPTF